MKKTFAIIKNAVYEYFNNFNKIGEYLKIAWLWFKNLIKRTDEVTLVWVTILITLMITLLIFVPKEIIHSKLIPLGFSEIEQIEIDAERKHKIVDPITEYYAKLNEIPNKVFECWNISLEFKIFGNNNESFAYELDARKNKIYKYEFDLFDTLPITIDKVLISLKKYIDLCPTLRNVEIQFSKVWTEDHDDEYKTKIYTTTSTDSDGNVTMETHSRQVYDHTDHSYWYHKREGEQAYRTGMKMMKCFYRLDWPGNLMRPSKTNAEGEYATDKSRRIDRHDRLSLLKIATMWNTGSLYNTLKADILSYNRMYSLIKTWEKDKDTAHDCFYETNSSSDAGPKPYQTVTYIKDLSSKVLASIQTLISSLRTTKSELPILKNKIKEYISVTLEGKKGNSNSLKREIISMSKNIYKRNFPQGINHNTFRVGWLFFWIFISVFSGFIIAYGLKRKIGDNYED